MENKYYEIRISVSEYVGDGAAPNIVFDSYEDAVNYARPWVEQGYTVIISINVED